MDLYDSFNQGSIYVDDPKVTMTVNSSFGFPTKAIVNKFLVQTKDGKQIPFSSKILDNGIYFNYPKLTESGQSKSTTVIFTKDNSNIRDIFNAQAKRIIYDIDALSNPDLIPDSTLFILDESKFVIHVQVDIPLKGRVSDYPAVETFETDASKLTSLQEGSLLIESTNTIPLSADAQIYLYDVGNKIIDSLFNLRTTLFKSASTGADGKSITAITQLISIPIPNAKINTWSNTRTVQVRAWFNSPVDKSVIQISQTDKLKIRMGYVGKLKL